MSLQPVASRSRRPPLRTLVPAALVVGLLAPMATGLVSAVREARNAAHSAATT